MKILGFKRLLGLAALGGGIYWMQKKRGGDMTFASIKENFRGVVDDLMNKANLQGAGDQPSTSDTSASRSTSASTPRQGYGSSTGYGSTGTYTGSGGYGGSGGGSNGGTRH